MSDYDPTKIGKGQHIASRRKPEARNPSHDFGEYPEPVDHSRDGTLDPDSPPWDNRTKQEHLKDDTPAFTYRYKMLSGPRRVVWHLMKYLSPLIWIVMGALIAKTPTEVWEWWQVVPWVIFLIGVGAFCHRVIEAHCMVKYQPREARSND